MKDKFTSQVDYRNMSVNDLVDIVAERQALNDPKAKETSDTGSRLYNLKADYRTKLFEHIEHMTEEAKTTYLLNQLKEYGFNIE